MRISINRYKLFGIICLNTLIFQALPLHAHHILGLPHYSYKENYPQAPVLEYPAYSGPYEILLTCYPGKPVPGETANLVFYAKNQQTDEPYEKSIQVRCLQTFTFGNNLEILEPSTIEPYEQPHKISVTFPQDGEYVVELCMEVEGKEEIIPFMLVVGNPSATGSILISVVLGLAAFIVIIRAIKIKRQRRLNVQGDSDEQT